MRLNRQRRPLIRLKRKCRRTCQQTTRLSKVELLFRRFDADRDGYLNCVEFSSYYKASGLWQQRGYTEDSFEQDVWPGKCADYGGASVAVGVPFAGWKLKWQQLGHAALTDTFSAVYPSGDPQVRDDTVPWSACMV